jgi:putative flavoprotein involved in K+ transport
MRRTTTIIIGAGHAGLAMSRCLTLYGVDHVLLERGEVANSWRTERWDSLRLLTPNWQSRLPGNAYRGDNPDGFFTVSETIDFIAGYASEINAPVETATQVLDVVQDGDSFAVRTSRGDWRCRTLIVASGSMNIPNIPSYANDLSPDIRKLASKDYRNPDQIEDGGVLVVGPSASGVQIAHELQCAGRDVILSVGEHVRMPRTYRGKDIHWLMDQSGLFDTKIAEVDDINRVRRLPSPQLMGSATRTTVGLNSLQCQGVEIVGRTMSANGASLQFSGALANVCRLADLKMNRLLRTLDDWIESAGPTDELDAAYELRPTSVPQVPRLSMNLKDRGVKTIIWATGFRPDYSWLNLPVFDRRGQLRHNGGVVDMPGVYAMGLPFMRKRKSTFIDGAGDDARDLSNHLAQYLAGAAVNAA